MTRSTFVYVTYIRTTPEKLWSALTDVEFIKQYWFGMHCEMDGSPTIAGPHQVAPLTQVHFGDAGST
jgi:uncharacterized protein YndB with AHSA1/START domain